MSLLLIRPRTILQLPHFPSDSEVAKLADERHSLIRRSHSKMGPDPGRAVNVPK
jgi:hypothetical protein